MTAETALRTALLANATVSAMVGTRIYPFDEVPESLGVPAPQFISHDRISTVSELLLDGSAPPDSIRVQLNCWAATFAKARDLSMAVTEALNGKPIDGTQLFKVENIGRLPRDLVLKVSGVHVDIVVKMEEAAEAA
jgi:hypothetical protein